MTRIRAITWSGQTWDDPSEDCLYDLLSELNALHRFLITERADSPAPARRYIKVTLEGDGSCLLEHRDGGPRTRYQAHVPAPFAMHGHDIAADVVRSWARDDGQWRTALAWEPGPEPPARPGQDD